MRNLYVIRHGEALPVGGDIVRDRDRPLSPRGVEDMRLTGKLCCRFDGGIGLVLCSPLLRARQSGEVFAEQLPVRPDVRESENLVPGFRPKALLQELRGIDRQGGVAVIGHQPDLSILLAFLLDGEAPSAIRFPPGAVACVGLPAGPASEAELQWITTPELLRLWSETR